jgi:uncharacterized protein YfiM (DUF2279 family)
MKAIVFILCVFCAGAVFAQDAWNGSDKKMHFGVSAVLGFAAGNQWPDNKPLAIGVALVPGLAKEIADSAKGGSGFSYKDLIADTVGVVFGVYSAHWLLSRNRGVNTMTYRTKF